MLGACSSNNSSNDNETNSDDSATRTSDSSAVSQNQANDSPLVPAAGDNPTREDCETQKTWCVGLITDGQQIQDNGFNQAAWTGVQFSKNALSETAEIKTQFLVPETASITEQIRTLKENSFDIIVTIGASLTEDTFTGALAYPDIAFVGVEQFQEDELDNLRGLVFSEDEAGYVAGSIAKLLTKNNKVWAIGGSDEAPAIPLMKQGWEKIVADDNSEFESRVSLHPGSIDKSFNDPDWGKQQAKQALADDFDVAFSFANQTGDAALEEFALSNEVANSSDTTEDLQKYCIGYEVDQWELHPEARDCLVTSVVKSIDTGVASLIALIIDGKLPEQKNIVGDISVAPFHDFDGVLTTEQKDTIAAIAVNSSDIQELAKLGKTASDQFTDMNECLQDPASC